MLLPIKTESDTFGVIHVTYPEGSICTCSGNGKKYTAKDTSGKWNFTIPEPGEYSINAYIPGTDDNKTTNVTLTEDNFANSIEIIYRKWLFKSGTGRIVNWTFGTVDHGKLVESTASIGINRGSQTSGESLLLTEAIDLTKYKTCYLDMEVNATGGGTYPFVSGIWNNNTNKYNVGGVVTKTHSSNVSRTTLTYDVSSLSGNYYIGLKNNGGGNIYNAYLE